MHTSNLTKLVGALCIAVPVALAANPAAAEDLVFDLVNDSSRVVTDFFVDGQNISVSDLYPGESVTVSIEDEQNYCWYDVTAYSAADENLTETIDFCEVYDAGYDLLITDDGFAVY